MWNKSFTEAKGFKDPETQDSVEQMLASTREASGWWYPFYDFRRQLWFWMLWWRNHLLQMMVATFFPEILTMVHSSKCFQKFLDGFAQVFFGSRMLLFCRGLGPTSRQHSARLGSGAQPLLVLEIGGWLMWFSDSNQATKNEKGFFAVLHFFLLVLGIGLFFLGNVC